MFQSTRAPARAQRSAPPGFVRPCAPTILGRPPAGATWTHEVKHDGYRIIARKDAAGARLWTRQMTECSARFVQITAAFAALPATSCTIDGEAVLFRLDGHSDFAALRSRAGAAAAALVCFDLLELDGVDLRKAPIETRRGRLNSLLRRRKARPGLILSEVFADEGRDVFGLACGLALEGIVSKRAGSMYRSGPSRDWVKTLNPDYRR